MKKDKGIALIILIIIIILVMPVLIFLFMNIIKDKTPNRNESNIEYTNTMKTHMEEKYSTSFEVVDSIFPEGGFNTGMLQNIVTLKDSDGVRCNVKADLNSPYDFYDDYIESCTAFLIESKLDSKLLKSEEARVYVSVEDDNINKADITLENHKK